MEMVVNYYYLNEIDDKMKINNNLLIAFDNVILEFCMINAYIWGIWAVNQSINSKISNIEYIDYAKNRLIYQYQYFKNLWTQQYKSNIVCLSNL